MSNIESEIQAKGLTAPRVTPADIEANILHELYFTAGGALRAVRDNDVYGPAVLRGLLRDGEDFDEDKLTGPLNLLTFCVLILRNGFTVTGESACASPENFDPEIGQKIARQNAINKVWPLMGYELKTKISNQE